MARVRPTIDGRPQSAQDIGSAAVDPDMLNRVSRILDAIRPTIQSDGGDVELVDITPEKIVRIRLHGACVGCPSAAVTLQLGIERNLRQYAPEITGVESVD